MGDLAFRFLPFEHVTLASSSAICRSWQATWSLICFSSCSNFVTRSSIPTETPDRLRLLRLRRHLPKCWGPGTVDGSAQEAGHMPTLNILTDMLPVFPPGSWADLGLTVTAAGVLC
jgi:hypothetical protein